MCWVCITLSSREDESTLNVPLAAAKLVRKEWPWLRKRLSNWGFFREKAKLVRPSSDHGGNLIKINLLVKNLKGNSLVVTRIVLFYTQPVTPWAVPDGHVVRLISRFGTVSFLNTGKLKQHLQDVEWLRVIRTLVTCKSLHNLFCYFMQVWGTIQRLLKKFIVLFDISLELHFMFVWSIDHHIARWTPDSLL